MSIFPHNPILSWPLKYKLDKQIPIYIYISCQLLLFHSIKAAMSDETAFPRGRSRLADPPLQEKGEKKREKPENDILFGQKQKTSESTKPSRKKRKTEITTDASGATSMLPLGGGGVIAPNQKRKEALIESISFQKLAKGTKLLGIVREISDTFALVSLPNLLTGYILTKEVSNLLDSFAIY